MSVATCSLPAYEKITARKREVRSTDMMFFQRQISSAQVHDRVANEPEPDVGTLQIVADEKSPSFIQGARAKIREQEREDNSDVPRSDSVSWYCRHIDTEESCKGSSTKYSERASQATFGHVKRLVPLRRHFMEQTRKEGTVLPSSRVTASDKQ